ncbi:MAG: DEAD/DEAH box helicase [Candidatus Woesearchaeota archaeon]
MELIDIKEKLNPDFYNVLDNMKITTLRPCQEKAINQGLLNFKNILVCTPTASGKTLVAEIAALQNITSGRGKAVYIVPLKALATEKFKSFKEKYGHLVKIALTIGDIDSNDSYLSNYDLIVCTAEKFDSLMRHQTPWLKYVSLLVIDEIHLMNDPGRGPTVEIIITLVKHLLKKVQILGLSATIGNSDQLSEWLNSELVIDDWRPVKLKHGVYLDGKIEYLHDSSK